MKQSFFRAWILVCVAIAAMPAFAAVREQIRVLPEHWEIAPADAPGKRPDAATVWKNSAPPTQLRRWYRVRIDIPATWDATKKIILEFRRLDGDAVVSVNGVRAGEVLNPCGELEIPVRPGAKNEILVYLTKDYFGISRPFEKDFLNYAARGPRGMNLKPAASDTGITGPVELRAVPRRAYVDGVKIDTSVAKKTIAFRLTAVAEKPFDGSADIRIDNADGKTVLELQTPVALQPGENQLRLEKAWANPPLWELDGGYCHTAHIRLRGRDGKTVDEMKPIRFGFRELGLRGRTILLNGRPARLRLTMLGLDHTANMLSLFRTLGFNCAINQPMVHNFYGRRSIWPELGDEMLDRLDRNGFGILLNVPLVVNLQNTYLESAELRAAYEQHVKRWMQRYGNHPSILAWIPSSLVSGTKENIHPDGMGIRIAPTRKGDCIMQDVFARLRKLDPSRLVMGYGDGANGDIATSHMYLNFIPLQEREEYPSNWAGKSDMPYIATEFGQPFTANFWEGNRYLATEYFAMYFGDRAYREERFEALPRLRKHQNRVWGNYQYVAPHFADYPLFYEFEKLFMRNTQRAWRTWGVNGWFNWDFDLGYGDPQGVRMLGYAARYQNLPEAVTAKPAWALPRWDYCADNNQPLMAYIAGAPAFTDKTHAFRSGGTLKKQFALIWDGPGSRKFKLRCTAEVGGRPQGTVERDCTLTPGTVRLDPFEFPLPKVQRRTGGRLKLELVPESGPAVTDEFPFSVWPAAPRVNAEFALIDPTGRTAAWFDRLGIRHRPWRDGDKTGPLVLGYRALDNLKKLPFTPADIRDGLRVVVLEQTPETLEKLGFRAIETMPRYTFPRNFSDPLFRGFESSDFINWSGTPTLLPEKKWARSHDFYHAPKWTNTHAVASVVLETPRLAGFEPLISCEFDLRYSPLFRGRYGRGALWFSTLDFTAHVGLDPAAEHFAARLLETCAAPAPAARKLYAAGLDGEQRKLAAELIGEIPDLPKKYDPKSAVLIAGSLLNWDQIRKIARPGTHVFVLPRDAAWLKREKFTSQPRTFHRLTPPVTASGLWRNIGPRLLRWRDALEVETIETAPCRAAFDAEKTVLEAFPGGAGRIVLCQLDPFQFSRRFAPDSEAWRNTSPSVETGFSLYAALLAELSAGLSDTAVARLLVPRRGMEYKDLNGWNVCGPFPIPGVKHDRVIYETTPAEADAIAGNALPDNVYPTRTGGRCDWRQVVSAGSDHAINLARELKTFEPNVIAYLTRKVFTDRDCVVNVRLGMDYFLAFYVNGKLVLDVRAGGGQTPKPNSHRIRVKLKQGENTFTIKIVPGSAGFCVYANMSEPEASESGPANAVAPVDLYPRRDISYDPYLYRYW